MPGTLLLITDISGFTRFVSSRSAEEGVRMATEMLQLILKSNELKLKLCEIEGDAVFLYSDDFKLDFSQISKQVRKTFRDFQDYLFRNNLVDQLGVKFIVHAGDCPRISVGGKKKLFGQEVIRVHRLLKRKSAEMNYLLITDAAAKFLGKVEGGSEGSTEFEHLGSVDFRLFNSSFLWSTENLERKHNVVQGIGLSLRQAAMFFGRPNIGTANM